MAKNSPLLSFCLLCSCLAGRGAAAQGLPLQPSLVAPRPAGAHAAPRHKMEPTAPAMAAAPASSAGPALQLRWAKLRAGAQLVQNRIGNAYTLQAGWTPQLRLRGTPVGLMLLAEISALRDQDKKVFAAPSTQLLLTYRANHHVELGLGAGVQFWCSHDRLVRPVATAEAHYLPHHRLFGVVHSAFVASSVGASSGAGLQVRAGLSIDFRPEPHPDGPRPTAPGAHGPLALQPPPLQLVAPAALAAPCPPCAAAAAAKAEAPPEDVLLASHLLFAFNAAALSDDALAYLRALGAALAAEPHAWHQLHVVGHADSVGTAAHNLLVSERRAAAVRGALLEAGLAPERIVAHGVGEAEPIVGIAEQQAAQRRVTLRLGGLHGSERLAGFVHERPPASKGAQP